MNFLQQIGMLIIFPSLIIVCFYLEHYFRFTKDNQIKIEKVKFKIKVKLRFILLVINPNLTKLSPIRTGGTRFNTNGKSYARWPSLCWNKTMGKTEKNLYYFKNLNLNLETYKNIYVTFIQCNFCVWTKGRCFTVFGSLP